MLSPHNYSLYCDCDEMSHAKCVLLNPILINTSPTFILLLQLQLSVGPVVKRWPADREVCGSNPSNLRGSSQPRGEMVP